MIEIRPGLSIPLSAVRFETSTASGPGGQHVNRAQTRVTLVFDLAGASVLDDAQKARIRARLPTRVDRCGRIRVRCGRHRRQSANRDEVIRRFAGLIAQALRRERPRVATKTSAGERRRRVEQKRRRAQIKQQRRRPPKDDD
jgi:ribosome-associated protein